MTDRAKWIWMPHPGHSCVSHQCRFWLNTYVGVLVSTIGEYVTQADMKAGHRLKFTEIGDQRLYETMVFRAVRNDNQHSACCPWEQSRAEFDFGEYNDPAAACVGHYAMCEKWSRLPAPLEAMP